MQLSMYRYLNLHNFLHFLKNCLKYVERMVDSTKEFSSGDLLPKNTAWTD